MARFNMQETPSSSPLHIENVHKHFMRGKRNVKALDGISLEIAPGSVNGLLGPDGAGKTTLIRLAAGLLSPDQGRISVLGMDSVRQARDIQAAISYMPQQFGLYEDLSVQENLNLYADLQGVNKQQRKEVFPKLMEMTGLAAFTSRLAGRLSGGMKQKLGLACTLLKTPKLLLLDEPTVGVDPLSRRELWEIVDSQVKERQLTVLMSTAYLDEAEQCDQVFILLDGHMLGQGPPQSFTEKAKNNAWLLTPKQGADSQPPRHLQSMLFKEPGVADATLQAGKVRLVTTEGALPKETLATIKAPRPKQTPPVFEDGFMLLLQEKAAQQDAGGELDVNVATPETSKKSSTTSPNGTAISVQGLERRFGDFYAVRDLTFNVGRGEIFGLLGPNGAGKSTTFRMLCGLLPASDGKLEVAGADLRKAAAKARQHVGYMAQKFSLYAQLTVKENLHFFAKAYGLHGKRNKERISWAMEHLDLHKEAESTTGELPFGIKQRLALACALMHEPDILFLDEPTSGVDPLARRQFWQRINSLSEQGVTVIVTTHFMEEAEYCDKMLIMMQGRLLAMGTPDEIRARTDKKDATVEDAFIHLVEEQRAHKGED